MENGEGSSNLQIIAKIARVLDIPVREIAEVSTLLDWSSMESFYAICSNPFCKRNTIQLEEGEPSVSWDSGQFYQMTLWNEVNFCPSCGKDLVKECPGCGKILEERGPQFCIRCGNPIHSRPTSEEWTRIRAQLGVDDDIPF